MFGIGMPEMFLILAIALIVIGPKKLPDLAKSLGRALGEFKRATSDFKDSMGMDELKDVKNAFDDMNHNVKEAIDMAPTDSDSLDPVDKRDIEEVKKEKIDVSPDPGTNIPDFPYDTADTDTQKKVKKEKTDASPDPGTNIPYDTVDTDTQQEVKKEKTQGTENYER